MQIPELVRDILESPLESTRFREATLDLTDKGLAPERDLASTATRAMFEDIVEPWADSFDPINAERYVAFMAEVVLAPRSPIRERLIAAGYSSPADLSERHRRVSATREMSADDRTRVKRVLVLSRVTLGADIAVTNTVAQSAREAFPEASVIFLGPRKNRALLGQGIRFTGQEVSYGRGSGLESRLMAWESLRVVVGRHETDVGRGGLVVADPDSRLTQLGMLPVCSDESYWYFPSRSHGLHVEASIKELATQWCWRSWNLVDPVVAPRIESLASKARGLHTSARRVRSGIAGVSFGFGGRQEKRLGRDFERSVIKSLRRRGFRIVIDYGFGSEEATAVEACLLGVEGSRAHVEIGQRLPTEPVDILTYRGPLEGFGRLIRGADVYVGYDSAGVHLAAALPIPVVDIFAGAPNEVMQRRWKPTGACHSRVVPASRELSAETILLAVDTALDEILEPLP